MNISNVEKLNFNIKDTDYILDVGGGHVPFPKANVIVDKFPENEFDKSQRANSPMQIPEGAKFIKMDATDMSCFKNKEFDFVVCAETLNHAKDPIAICKEINRVGKRGYIEMPSALYELLASHLEHLWVCIWDGKTLKFTKSNYPENTMGTPTDGRPPSLRQLPNKNIQSEAYRLMHEKAAREATYIEFVWEGNFNYEVID